MNTPLSAFVLVLVLVALSARSEAPVVWPGSFLGRVELLAILESFNAELLSHPSATATLERWCGAHHLAPEARVVARLVRGSDKPLPEPDRSLLAIGPDETVRYRRVQLFCGERLLSEADNWYVPSRLTAEMNRLLDETDTPFGRVVAPLKFNRETLSAVRLWSPLPDGWEMAAVPPTEADPATALRVPEHVLRHRAILYSGAHVPFSEVVETYTNEVFAFQPPPAP